MQCLKERANGTFLWVALVCKKLEKMPPSRALLALNRFPAGLKPLYQRMLQQVEGRIDSQDYDKEEEIDEHDIELRRCLPRSRSSAFRPLSVIELGVLAGLEQELWWDE